MNFGGNRHAFLPFSEIHPDYFRIPVADREALMAAQQAEIEAAMAAEEAAIAEEEAALAAEEAARNNTNAQPADNHEEISSDVTEVTHSDISESSDEESNEESEENSDESEEDNSSEESSEESGEVLMISQKKTQAKHPILEQNKPNKNLFTNLCIVV